jgi:hypothetical protein
MTSRATEAADQATLTIRRMRGGELRAFVGGQLLAGVKAIQAECVGFGLGSFNLRVSGKDVRLEDEAKGESDA